MGNATPGPELDRQVAEEVLLWKEGNASIISPVIAWFYSNGIAENFCLILPSFSTDHNAFFQYVVPAMREMGFYLSIQDYHDYARGKFVVSWCGETYRRNINDSIPRAGCLAALEAIRAMKGGG